VLQANFSVRRAQTRTAIKKLSMPVVPNPAALLRLAGSVLVEAHDEWQFTDKR
jgi:hypothetical protein